MSAINMRCERCGGYFIAGVVGKAPWPQHVCPDGTKGASAQVSKPGEQAQAGRMSDYDSRPDTYEHIGKVRAYLGKAAANLIVRGDVHDASKLVEPELEAFDRMTPLLAKVEYGTPEYKEGTRQLGAALEHHYAHNSHHPEHYANGISGMSLFDLLEMVCDWMAASERMRKPMPAAPGRPEAPKYDSDFERSVALNQERFAYSDEVASILVNTAREMGWLRGAA